MDVILFPLPCILTRWIFSQYAYFNSYKLILSAPRAALTRKKKKKKKKNVCITKTSICKQVPLYPSMASCQ